MSKSDPKSCNRQPFLSEAGCDRGNVDIHQFDDFPYCETIDPPMPSIPPVIVANPIQIPVPPSCACVNIKYALNFKYSNDRKFGASADFTASGDCCEGNYVSNFNLQIPCPVLEGGSKKIKMKIGYGTGKASAAESYIKTNTDSCTVEAKDVDINLNIPCPIKDASGKKIKIGISYGEGPNGASASFIKANTNDCEIEPLSPTLHLNLPCPIIGRVDSPKIKASIKYGNGNSKVSASYIKADPKACAIEPLSPNINLNIPCPVKDAKGKKIKIGISYGNGKKEVSAPFLRTDTEKCEVEARDVNLNLNLPCPVRKDDKPPKIKAKIKWGNSGQSASASFLTADPDSCQIRGTDAVLNLNIPCPIKSNGSKYIKIGKQKIEFVKFSNSTCEMSFGDASFDIDLDVPCPITPQGDREITFGALKFGTPEPVKKTLANLTDCKISMQSPEFSLNVPCALQNIKIEKGTIKTEGSTGEFTIRDTGSPTHANCQRTFTIDVTFPNGGGDVDLDKELICAIQYNASRHALQVKTYNPKKKTESNWKDVFTAVSHRSDHACCNDV